MEIQLICIGKTDDPDLQKLISNYENRLKHYIKFTLLVIPDIKDAKNLSKEQQKTKEGELIENQIRISDVVVLLDENGKEFSSVGFSEYLNKKMSSGCKRLIFIIGGPYGFSKTLQQKYKAKISLSQMTFSHQMIRLFFVEQLYRANTILKNEPYHHR
ncbi:MAG: 23S rRNA (pseudouridine(1915)-N(3))-methyltransferase RlmH [Flavobacteriaceae bacterium]|jgi:23S rRNA (pseudouridine1915-N3)-methyltransferase|nr:23S rRNA (pseudouridine(1915)-N(3))-methyltransferase RlmH [Flavobacteriaceae bacterium]MDO7581077.1 23S rRNA (pseudouridine(1915)-N(3))-methyltransferase RlmH [Flavobacteriaceae bacterium]MDO7591508.1 23S rRNA (pseudouridine(1915)-N(3))-methyltransferase RlmH [Flavobacteriaceae bacterium]MDO7598647.1 23S rRNA (pseudouridine(1915)-N(3))-methyltransferase RlmH [Flavobacteriaceae bacterium]MDO7602506.1 23S rRNA (pseudouridine(1915)-N(3))-methyltransferase RlmH [Flavobacteriaceae bacterium]|tara:strand:- start:392 stop:865 length:474 start_codon:yes stop_codon:yes gene_type:complete